MDARINDFFNEINEISPPVDVALGQLKSISSKRSTKECAWQECFDDTSGYPYYWNVNTNAVTWEMPTEYQEWLKTNQSSHKTGIESSGSGDTQKPLFPSALNAVSDTTPSISQTKTITVQNAENSNGNNEIKKIRALPSYLIDSDHDSLEGHSSSRNGSITNSPLHSNNSKSNSRANSDNETTDEVKPTLGFSLLANYGDSDDDDDDYNDDDAKEEETPLELKTEGHSTLFPVTKPIDVNQFKQTSEIHVNALLEPEEIDVKAFKRKRRIGVHLVNHPKREISVSDDTNKAEAGNCGNNEKAGSFKTKFGMSFVRGDTLPPSSIGTEKNGNVDQTQTTIKEKLSFLSEGREPVGPVQIMSIQLETLYNAWKSGNLNAAYFTTWIKDISNDLVKLEEDATPEGWHLEWDRNEKRYYYRNKANNECQWEYPQCEAKSESAQQSPNQRDIGNENDNRIVDDDDDDDDDDDAMDICTTPPPMEAANDGSNIEVISISAAATDDTNLVSTVLKDENCNSPEGRESKDFNSVLDSFYSDIAAIETATTQTQQKQQELEHEQQNHEQAADTIVANNKSQIVSINTNVITTAITTTNSIITTATSAAVSEFANVSDSSITSEPAKKKKKVKMSQGISMKKKGVSQMVEKWKNVQKDLD